MERLSGSASRQEGTTMKSHMDGEVKWVWILTSVAICYVVTLLAI